MNKLNQFIMEGKLSKWADYCEKNPAIDCYDDTDESLVIEYECKGFGYAAYLDISEDMLPKYKAFTGHEVRIVGKLAGDTLIVEHLEVLD
jgi:hypothetical protein